MPRRTITPAACLHPFAQSGAAGFRQFTSLFTQAGAHLRPITLPVLRAQRGNFLAAVGRQACARAWMGKDRGRQHSGGGNGYHGFGGSVHRSSSQVAYAFPTAQPP
ncbi:hypothetical protein [Porphyrobacter sp. MBR-155]|uniref:hypothetical protein n=1 Tax=Porphyrobacter sp. MBR-155 TaxID=3156464 RepID=UPI003395C459